MDRLTSNLTLAAACYLGAALVVAGVTALTGLAPLGLLAALPLCCCGHCALTGD